MKKLILLFVFIGLSFTAQAQDKILFHVQYKPEMKYEQSTEQTSDMTMTYAGSEEFLQKIKEKGLENPTIKKSKTTVKMDILTAKLKKDQFPLTMEVIESTSSDGKNPIPNGTLIYGHCIPGNTPVIDSVAAKDINEELRKVLMQVMQSLFSQITFPKKEIKVGESFDHKTPLSLPIGGLTIDMDITTTYKLLSVKNGLANFDIVQVYKMKTEMSDAKIKASGSGKGTMVYDIANNFFLNYNLNNDMKMAMKMEGFSLDLKLINLSVQNTKFSPNK